MSGKRYPEEFRTGATKQVVDLGYSIASVMTRPDIVTHSFHTWTKKYGLDSSADKKQSNTQAEICHLQKGLKRVTDERDILKKAVVDSICQRNTPFNYLFRCFRLQCLPRSVVQLSGNQIQLMLNILDKTCLFRRVLPDQPICTFGGAASLLIQCITVPLRCSSGLCFYQLSFLPSY